jgi:integrase
MLPNPLSRHRKRKSNRKPNWRKVPRSVGLYQYLPNSVYHARVKHGGRVHRESLKTKDLAFAKRKLANLQERLKRTDPRYGKITLVEWLEKHYLPTLTNSPGALAAKQRVAAKIKGHWLAARTQPMRDLKRSEVLRFLSEQYGGWSASYWNSALTLVRDAFDLAVQDHVLMENPALDLKWRRRKQPIRLTPTFEQFQAIIADVRAQPFNRDAEDSGDFLEFMGLAGLGQAEVAAIRRCHVDLDASQIGVYRQKTTAAFVIPIYPQVRPLVEKLCEDKKPNDRLFTISQGRKALTNACARLELPNFTQRSLRRLFITRAIERGVDVKVIALFQGHKDGGKLILDTYSHVRPAHAQRMAALLTLDEPQNVIPIPAQAEAS